MDIDGYISHNIGNSVQMIRPKNLVIFFLGFNLYLYEKQFLIHFESGTT